MITTNDDHKVIVITIIIPINPYIKKKQVQTVPRVRHGGTALDASEVKQHSLCASLLRRAGGRHSMQRAVAAAAEVMKFPFSMFKKSETSKIWIFPWDFAVKIWIFQLDQ